MAQAGTARRPMRADAIPSRRPLEHMLSPVSRRDTTESFPWHDGEWQKGTDGAHRITRFPVDAAEDCRRAELAAMNRRSDLSVRHSPIRTACAATSSPHRNAVGHGSGTTTNFAVTHACLLGIMFVGSRRHPCRYSAPPRIHLVCCI
ncbi:hypothetical protein [Burkholderia sp.]|uniref:hypothetical protein n=1 Tax=Burkholderia sp. TaxID=36773 RepID=UPI0025C47E93|nr:hypothetical protein [Burkholderia sp.]MBS6363183.1 hypothetical protein [Burkholderia sp.]